MKTLSADELRSFLKSTDAVSPRKAEDIVAGFDFDEPVYLNRFEPSRELFQFMRNPSHGDRNPGTGNWFALSGATMAGLAIFGGGSGRHLHRFVVNHEFIAVEGTASALPPNWSWSGGGPGGHTQIYVPSNYLGHLTAVGRE